MRFKYLLSAVLLAVVLPGILLSLYNHTADYSPEPSEPPTLQTQEANSVLINVLINTQVQEMELEDYITGVVLAEMPASFQTEALKAQAVVARTFTLKRTETKLKHNNADVCTDYACCQAYCSPEAYLLNGGKEEDIQKVRAAVVETAGQILTYQGELIDATYFSCSGGRTEDAVAVWGAEIPYLQATDSPGEEYATHYTDTVSFSLTDFCDILAIHSVDPSKKWIGTVTYTDGGGVESIILNGKQYKGIELRQKLGLRSTAFVISVVGDTVIITTKGFGHRVGMSQYGADAMASRGSTYGEILYHYYNGTVLSTYKP